MNDLSNHQPDVGSPYDHQLSPEEFAEKTLEAFNLNTYNKYLQPENNHSTTNYSLANNMPPPSDDESDPHFQCEEIPLPDKPNALEKRQFKFPAWTSDNLIHIFKNFSWNNLVLSFFSPQMRKKIHSYFLVLLVGSIAYLLGKNGTLFFTKFSVDVNIPSNIQAPPEKLSSTIQDINKITAINLFNARESEAAADNLAKKKDISSIVCLNASKPTTLQIKLLDTIVLQDSVKSVASVQVRGSSELQNVREGELLDQMAEVSKIIRFKIILKNLETGDCEYVSTEEEDNAFMPNIKVYSRKEGQALLKRANPNIRNVGNNFKIKKAFRDSMINKISDVLTQAKAVQITNPDGSLCFKMTEVAQGSLYSLLNIEENDIVCNINGKKIENLNELMNLLGRVKEIDQFQLGLTRNGMPKNLKYSFE